MQILKYNGCALSYRVKGDGPPVLFIQGVGLHGDGWCPQVAELSSQYTCLTFDNRGVGSSQPSGTSKLTVDLMADDAITLAEQQGWRDYHVVGHGMGGHIATVLALIAPQRVRSLTLICTSGWGKEMPPRAAALLGSGLRSRLGTRRQRRHAFLQMVLPRRILATEDLDEWAGRLAAVFGYDLADAPPIVLEQVRAYRAYDARGSLDNLRGIPTLVVGAAEDPLSPPSVSRRLAAGIPRARCRVIRNAAHGVTVTHASEMNALLARHFSAADSARRT